MMTFNTTNIRGENPMWSRFFMLNGDGESTTLRIDLTAAPVGMEFRGDHKPVLALHRSYEGPSISSLTLADASLTFEFCRPPAHGERVDIPIEFYYEGNQ